MIHDVSFVPAPMIEGALGAVPEHVHGIRPVHFGDMRVFVAADERDAGFADQREFAVLDGSAFEMRKPEPGGHDFIARDLVDRKPEAVLIVVPCSKEGLGVGSLCLKSRRRRNSAICGVGRSERP